MTARLTSALAKSALALVALCILLSPRSTFADDVIFSNLGPGNSFQSAITWAIAGPTSLFASLLGGSPESVAAPFTPSANFDLSQLFVALDFDGGTNGVGIFLESSIGGLPGTVLESWSLSGLPGSPGALEDLSAAGVLPLSAGTKYWVVVAPIASDTSAGWFYNNTGDVGEFRTNNGFGWTLVNPAGQSAPLPAFEVTGTAVPEPSTLLLLAAGLLMLVPLTRRRLSAARLG